MRAVGLIAGGGSLLREAADAGYEIAGCVDPRPYFRGGHIWDLNFPDAPFFAASRDAWPDDWYGADLALGHPPCASHSQLGHTVGGRAHPTMTRAQRDARLAARRRSRGLLPLFVNLVRTLEPKVFALDNLPKILGSVATPAWWAEQLPDYRCTFLTLTNWDFGSPQRRVRLWVIGARGRRPFNFKPPARRLPGPTSTRDALAGLSWEPWIDVPKLGHLHRPQDWRPWGGYWSVRRRSQYKMTKTWELALGMLLVPPKYNWPYISTRGKAVRKLGRQRAPVEGISPVFSGEEILHHPLTGWPLTPRERARLLGWPDDFRIWSGHPFASPTEYARLVRSTGKAVPSELPRFLIPQLRSFARRI